MKAGRRRFVGERSQQPARGILWIRTAGFPAFGLIFHDGEPSLDPPVKTNPDGSLVSVYAEDQLRATSWLMLNAGLRQTHFSGGVVENATDPRVGASVRIPKLKWVFRGFYGHFYQAPPLETITGPLIDFVTLQNLGFIPLHGERDEEHQFGVTIPLFGWTIDADNFLTRAKNFFDHNNLNNSDVFFPITIQGARINGWELTLRSPRIHNRGHIYLTYSNQLALGFGDINGGLTDFSFGDGFGLARPRSKEYVACWRAVDAAVAIVMSRPTFIMRRDLQTEIRHRIRTIICRGIRRST